MRLERFAQHFSLNRLEFDLQFDDARSLLSLLGGSSFGDGVFKFFELNEVPSWNDVAGSVFTRLEGSVSVFGYDWLGRIFALDLRNAPMKPKVVLLDIATIYIYHINKTLNRFLNEEIPSPEDPCLAENLYRRWLSVNRPVPVSMCAGYSIPLFLSGEDDFSNMEIVDMEAYWETTRQLWQATRELPEGARIGGVSFQ